MIKKLIANTLARKIAVFASAFLVTCVLIGIQAASPEPVRPPRTAVVPVRLSMARSAPPKPVTHDDLLLAEQYSAEADPATASQEEEPAVPAINPSVVPMPAEPVYDSLGFSYISDIPFSYELQQYTYQRCQKLGIEYEMVLAVIWRESRFQPHAVNVNTNGTRDSGLMQINDVNRQWLSEKHGIEDLMDPYQNIDAGTTMLSGFMKKYSEDQALMAYQYGESGMLSKWEQGVTTNMLTELVKQKRDYFKQLRMA